MGNISLLSNKKVIASASQKGNTVKALFYFFTTKEGHKDYFSDNPEASGVHLPEGVPLRFIQVVLFGEQYLILIPLFALT